MISRSSCADASFAASGSRQRHVANSAAGKEMNSATRDSPAVVQTRLPASDAWTLFVRAALPGMQNATAIVHTAPAKWRWVHAYTDRVRFAGVLQPHRCRDSFMYSRVRSRFRWTASRRVSVAGWVCVFSGGSAAEIRSISEARAAVIEKPYIFEDGLEKPVAFTGNERNLEPKPLAGCESTQLRTLIPADFGFDFAVNHTFAPGRVFPWLKSIAWNTAFYAGRGWYLSAGRGMVSHRCRRSYGWHPTARNGSAASVVRLHVISSIRTGTAIRCAARQPK